MLLVSVGVLQLFLTYPSTVPTLETVKYPRSLGFRGRAFDHDLPVMPTCNLYTEGYHSCF